MALRTAVGLGARVSPQRRVKPDVAVLMPQSSPEPIFVARVRESFRNKHPRFSVEKEIGISVLSFRQVGIHIEIVGFCFDHSDYVVGWDRKPEARGVAVHELRDDLLASVVELLRLEVETLDRASERIAKQLHFRLPVAFTPSALRNAR